MARSIGSAEELAHRLASMPVFACVPQEELIGLAAGARCDACGPGETVLGARDDRDRVIAILSGAVCIEGLPSRGHQVTLHHLYCGEVFGLAFLDRALASALSIKAARQGAEVCRIQSARFSELAGRRPEVSMRMMQAAHAQLSRALQLLRDRLFEPVGIRLAHFLELQARTSKSRDVVMTHESIAAAIGSTQPEVSRQLHRLEQLRLVALDGKAHRITIVDAERLAGVTADDLSPSCSRT